MPRGSRCVPLAAALLSVLAGSPAVAGGAWTTFLRANSYSDVVAQHDTIWCASPSGGLLRYLRAEDRFESLPREPGGLSSQALTALAFDRSGRLWVGSRDQGLSRLSADGSRWDLVSQLDGLPGGAVTALRAVGDTMLIGTEQGVALWNGEEIAGTVPEGVNPSPFASDVVTGLVLRGDSLWVATEQGLYVSPGSTGYSEWDTVTVLAEAGLLGLAWDGRTLMTVVSGTPLVFDDASGAWNARGGIGPVRGLSDDRGAIVACSDWGVYLWNGAAWVVVPGGPASPVCSVENDPNCRGTAAVTTDEGDRLWVANRDGLREWADGTWTLHEPDAVVGNDIQNLALQGARVYVATFNEGVGRFDGVRWRNWFPRACGGGCDTTFLSSRYAFSLLVDREGRKWVGNWSSAMESFDDDVSPPQFTHYQIPDSLGADRHTFGWSAAFDDSGGRWFGMDSPDLLGRVPIGIEYYDPAGSYRANYRPENTPGMRSSQVRALVVDTTERKVWVGYAGKGMTVFELPEPGGTLKLVYGGELSKISTLDVFGIVAFKDSIWVMSTDSLRRFSATSVPPQQMGVALPITGSPASRGACHPLDVGPDGTVWVGTDGGVHAYRRDGRIVEYTVANSPLAGDEVRAIRVDPVTGVVWIGTATGLSRFDPGYVAPPAPPLAALDVRAYPNPALLTGAGLYLRLAGNASAYRVAVYDASGRRLHRGETRNAQVFWDGRDASGGLVPPGVYFVRVEAGGRARTVRVALLR